MHRANQCLFLSVRGVFDVGLVLLWRAVVLNGDCVKVELIWCLIGSPLWWRVERIECFGNLEQRERAPLETNLISKGTPQCFSAFLLVSHTFLTSSLYFPYLVFCLVEFHSTASHHLLHSLLILSHCLVPSVFFFSSVCLSPHFPLLFLRHTLLV